MIQRGTGANPYGERVASREVAEHPHGFRPRDVVNRGDAVAREIGERQPRFRQSLLNGRRRDRLPHPSGDLRRQHVPVCRGIETGRAKGRGARDIR